LIIGLGRSSAATHCLFDRVWRTRGVVIGVPKGVTPEYPFDEYALLPRRRAYRQPETDGAGRFE
jgi:hypothetical protein